jgi:tetratricopeptide (TPR) repeat protein
MIQNVRPDSVPALGGALHRLSRGDTAQALEELAAAAAGIPADGGRTVVLTFAGRLAVDREDFEKAEAYLLAAIAADAQSASAPAAAYHLARVYESDGRDDEARVRLENLILEYPASAVVPLARRMLERITGGIPRG